MSFPEFLPTVPVFVRTRAKQHQSKTLIALDDARVSYAEAESHAAPARGPASSTSAGSRRCSRSESTADTLGFPPVSLRGDPVP